jgi:phospholipase C
MKVIANALPLLFCFGTIAAYAQIAKFDHIVIVVQENRSPDNLFQGVCSPPYGAVANCSASPKAGQYNIQTGNWLDIILAPQPE